MKKGTFKLVMLAFLLAFSNFVFGQIENDAPLSVNAPTDRPHNIKGEKQLDEYEKLIEPYLRKAKETLPKAKMKFLKGLKKGESFFLTTRIYDKQGNFEQIFVRVTEWNDDEIQGTIANQLNAVKGFKYGQLIKFPESAILDWLITKPNGDEEGNFVGKFLDTLE